VRGELRELSGVYLLKDVGGDTDVTCEITVDAGIPLLTDEAVEQVLAGHIERTLSRLKASAEREVMQALLRGRRAAAPGRDDDDEEIGEAAADDRLGETAAGAASVALSAGSGAGDEGDADEAGEDEGDEADESAGAPGETTVPAGAGDAVPVGDRPRRSRRRRRRRGRGRRAASGSGRHGPPASRP
jgi:hypothetical protein